MFLDECNRDVTDFNGAELGFSLLSVEKGKDVSRIVHVY